MRSVIKNEFIGNVDLLLCEKVLIKNIDIGFKIVSHKIYNTPTNSCDLKAFFSIYLTYIMCIVFFIFNCFKQAVYVHYALLILKHVVYLASNFHYFYLRMSKYTQ